MTYMNTGSWLEDRAEKLEMDVGNVRFRVLKTARILELCLW